MLDVLFGGLNPPFPMHLVGGNMELRPIWLLKFRIRDPQNAAKCIERGYMISLYIYIHLHAPFFDDCPDKFDITCMLLILCVIKVVHVIFTCWCCSSSVVSDC